MKKFLCFVMVLFISLAFAGCGANNTTKHAQNSPTLEQPNNITEVTSMNLKIGNKKFVVNLENNETTKALVKMLPLTIDMLELNGNEKYYYLPSSLPTNASKISYINAGDVMLYGNNCLVIFYKSFSSGYSYTKIGHIEDVENLASTLGSGSVQVVWEV